MSVSGLDSDSVSRSTNGVALYYLVIVPVAGGNQAPILAISQKLRDAGHRVKIAGYESVKNFWTDAGLEFLPLPQASPHWNKILSQSPVASFMDFFTTMMALPSHVDEINEILDAEQPDRLIVDCLMFGILAGLEKRLSQPQKRQIPVNIVIHTTVEGMKNGGKFLIPLLNGFRESQGLSPLENPIQAYSLVKAESVQVTSIPLLDSLHSEILADPNLKPLFRWIGPQIPRSPASNFTLPWPSSDPRPLILVGFSTEPTWPMKPRLEKTLTALGSDPTACRVICTYSVVKLDDFQVAENIHLVERVPHTELFPFVSLTITHGGHGTVSTSLAYGVPVLVTMPVGFDQILLGKKMIELGTGLSLEREDTTPEEIKDAVQKILAEPSYKQASQTVKAAIQEYTKVESIQI